MAAVVNHLHFKDPVDATLLARAETELGPAMRAITSFRGFHMIQISDRHVILIIMADTVQALDKIATEVGSPWMLAHVVPFLDRPPQRHIGPTIASVVP